MNKEQTAILCLRESLDLSLTYYQLPTSRDDKRQKCSEICIVFFEQIYIPFEVIHNNITVDIPKTVYLVREDFLQLGENRIKCTIVR